MMLQNVIQFLLYDLSNGRLQEVKNNRKLQTFNSTYSKTSRGRLREVVGYKRFRI